MPTLSSKALFLSMLSCLGWVNTAIAETRPMALFVLGILNGDEHKSDVCFVQRDFAYVLRAFFDPGSLVRKDMC